MGGAYAAAFISGDFDGALPGRVNRCLLLMNFPSKVIWKWHSLLIEIKERPDHR